MIYSVAAAIVYVGRSAQALVTVNAAVELENPSSFFKIYANKERTSEAMAFT